MNKLVTPGMMSIGLILISFVIMGQSCQKETEKDLWKASAHADNASMAFRDWDEATPPEVPVTCARCHTTAGFQDYIGADGSKAGSVETPVPASASQGITCNVCHMDENGGTPREITSVTFPSGKTISTTASGEGICMTCHQGRESTVSVNKALTGITDDNSTSRISFRNIHYFAAAATLYGTDAQGGYEYTGITYKGQNKHTADYNTCIKCHNPHSLKPAEVAVCSKCHAGVTDTKDIRMSSEDFDGDGNADEGIYYEIQGLQEQLYAKIQTYAKNVCGTAIAYDAAAYPYFFIDANGNGTVDTDETSKYNAFSPRLAKAAYNYQVSIKDPGAYVHNGVYVCQLLKASLDDINAGL
ncbi:MAG: polyheme membrane-associated cytochrome C [Pseudomonadota bacterium]